MSHVFRYNVPVRGRVTRCSSVIPEQALDKCDLIRLLRQRSGDHLQPCLIYSCTDKLTNKRLLMLELLYLCFACLAHNLVRVADPTPAAVRGSTY